MASLPAPPPPVSVDAAGQDPLPEAKWFFRRIYIFVLSTIFIIGVGWLATWIHQQPGGAASEIIAAEYKMVRWILLLLWFAITYYLVAPSAEQVTRMWQTASVLKSGTAIFTRQTATGADGSTATATTSTAPALGGQAGFLGADGANNVNGLPVNAEPYEGPPEHDLPQPPPNAPEHAPW